MMMAVATPAAARPAPPVPQQPADPLPELYSGQTFQTCQGRIRIITVYSKNGERMVGYSINQAQACAKPITEFCRVFLGHRQIAN